MHLGESEAAFSPPGGKARSRLVQAINIDEGFARQRQTGVRGRGLDPKYLITIPAAAENPHDAP